MLQFLAAYVLAARQNSNTNYLRSVDQVLFGSVKQHQVGYHLRRDPSLLAQVFASLQRGKIAFVPGANQQRQKVNCIGLHDRAQSVYYKYFQGRLRIFKKRKMKSYHRQSWCSSGPCVRDIQRYEKGRRRSFQSYTRSILIPQLHRNTLSIQRQGCSLIPPTERIKPIT